MNILSVESSAVSAGICILQDGRLLAADFQNCGLTHSRTLLPMIEHLLTSCGLTVADIDGFAVAAGPGSFTGIRIGVSTIKGLALAYDTPCVAVSTLEAMAWGLLGLTGEVSCVMDARAGQIYHARFSLDTAAPVRLCEDRAIPITQLEQEIGTRAQILVGDGAHLCYTKLKDSCPQISLAPPHLLYPTGFGVAMAGQVAFAAGQASSASLLQERYLRAPQAQRERAAKLAQENTTQS